MGNEIKYDKLVRDKIPQIIEDIGKDYTIHTADDKEYVSKLYAKVLEELDEFKENPSAEEMADIFEVLEGLMSFYALDREEVEIIRKRRKKSVGTLVIELFWKKCENKLNKITIK